MPSKLTTLLKSCALNGEYGFMTYMEFGERFGLGNFPLSWANRRTLDTAAHECKADPETGHLDLTFLIHSSRTKYPSVVDGKPFDSSNPKSQMKRAREEAQRIIDRFKPGAPNPY